MKIRCEESTDGGASRIKGWHNFYPCQNCAKWLVKYKSGEEKRVCGIHKNQIINRTIKSEIESITPLTKSK